MHLCQGDELLIGTVNQQHREGDREATAVGRTVLPFTEPGSGQPAAWDSLLRPEGEGPRCLHCTEAAAGPREDPQERQKQLKKKQKNRVAAQRSRQKHTDRADALHQQESLEKHNEALRKEIRGLQAELTRWSQTLQLHEHLCPRGCSLHPAPEPPDCWGQGGWLPGQLAPQGQHSCQEQPGLFQSPVSCLPAQRLHPDPQPGDPCGLLPSPLSLLSLSPAVVTLPLAQMCSSHVPSASPTGPSLLGSSPQLSGPLLSSSAQATPPHPLGQEPPSSGELESSLEPEYLLQGSEHKAGPSVADWTGSALEPSRQSLLAFPLVASAQVHF
ncbi:basic leucine zipper transcriptional factor ATF-like 2 isoform X2 [Octodon degus]|uniref:Basic leucine zipper transcriptional factor ATF-like 2 n=1 Tax=Octodon degus TaxID=10160 RepID=A0A6P6DI94_OCTDE|nr:basic leucine zipper transcriptional factor ATF-like 2 isoform X2 [Octodon degus]